MINVRYIATIDQVDYFVEIIDEKHIALNGQVYEIDFASVSDQPIYPC